ncbi:MAG: hypothetical protein COA68_16795 [Oceanobacter sp.]|nr:MAG: hypothetical protein COA68_16795 [Oceanobacter sp.]
MLTHSYRKATEEIAFRRGHLKRSIFSQKIEVVLALVGSRDDLPSYLGSIPFLFKASAMVLLAGGCAILVRAAAIPGFRARPIVALWPTILFLLTAVVLDQSGLPLTGVHPPLSATACVGTIIAASLPAIGLIVAALRRGTPTKLRQAGFFAGLLAGALGAMVYSVFCENDGAAFVALWYSLAVVIVGCIGAVLGPKWLAW